MINCSKCGVFISYDWSNRSYRCDNCKSDVESKYSVFEGEVKTDSGGKVYLVGKYVINLNEMLARYDKVKITIESQ